MTTEELDKFLKDHGIKHFNAAEITRLHRLQKCAVPHPDLWSNIVPTLQLADEIRSEWGHPVRVFSGYRTENYNKAVGGAPNSQHKHFRALDLSPRTVETHRANIQRKTGISTRAELIAYAKEHNLEKT